MENLNRISLEEQEILDCQPYEAMPISIREVLRSCPLTPTAYKLYEYLYAEFKKNSFSFGKEAPVILSIKKLCQVVHRKTTAVKHAISQLKSFGWLCITGRYHPETGSQLCSMYWVRLPQQCRSKIFSCAPRRLRSSHKVVFEQRKDQGKTEKVQNIFSMKDNTTEAKALLKRYEASVKIHCESGVSLLNVAKKMKSEFSDEELLKIRNEYSRSEKINPSKNTGSKYDRGGVVKPDTYQYNNLQYVDLVNKDKKTSGTLLQKGLKNQNLIMVDSENQRVLHDRARKSLLALDAEKKIPCNLFSDGKQLKDLVFELAYHATHYNPSSVRSPLHALQGGVRMIKLGTWDTPKKLKCQRYYESLRLEEEAKQLRNEWQKRKIKKFSDENSNIDLDSILREVPGSAISC